MRMMFSAAGPGYRAARVGLITAQLSSPPEYTRGEVLQTIVSFAAPGRPAVDELLVPNTEVYPDWQALDVEHTVWK